MWRDYLYFKDDLRQIRQRVDSERIDGEEVVVVGLQLAVFIPKLGKVGPGLENDQDGLNNSNQDVFHEDMEDVKHHHHLYISKEAQAVKQAGLTTWILW